MKIFKFLIISIMFLTFLWGTVFAADPECWPVFEGGRAYSPGTKVSYERRNYTVKNQIWWSSTPPPGADFTDEGPCDDGFGDQNDTPQQFMTMGCDLSNPLIDPYLLAHSVYADSLYLTWDRVHSPKNGIVGTAGTIKVGQGSGTCSYGFLTLQTPDGGYFRTLGTGVVSSGGAKFRYFNMTASVSGCLQNSTKGAVYSDLDEANPCRTEADPTKHGLIKPRFPKIEEVSSKFTASNDATGTQLTPGSYRNLNVGVGQTVKMQAGTYFFNGNIEVEEEAKLIVTPDINGSFKTVIYVKDRLWLHAGREGIAKGGAFIPEGFQGGCEVPKDAEGQILLIAFGTGIEDQENGDDHSSKAAILFGSVGTAGVGTFIAPRGGIFPMAGSIVVGQLMSKVIKFAWGYADGNSLLKPAFCSNIPAGTLFKPLVPPKVELPKELLEDSTWTNSADKNAAPQYKDGKPWEPGKNRDHVTRIEIKLSENKEGASFPYEIIGAASNNNYVRIGELSNFPSGDLTGGAWRNGVWTGERAFVKSKLGQLDFAVGEKVKYIDILVVDDDEYQSDENSTFFIKINVPGAFTVQDPCNCDGPGNTERGFTIVIRSDDPDKPHKPTLDNQERVVEKYTGLAPVKVGVLKTNKPEYELKLTDNAGGWFELKSNNEIWTTPAFNANYDAPDNQQEVIIKAIALGIGTVSDTGYINVKISPWNDNPFGPAADMEDIAFVDETGEVLINVLLNDGGARDVDLPASANKQLLIGVTTTKSTFAENVPNPVFSTSDLAQAITLPSGAKVSIVGGQVKYDIKGLSIPECNKDVFYYTALDTAEYTDNNGVKYETDVWAKSIKVTVINYDLPQPDKENSFYYDVDGNGIVDKIVIPFNKNVDASSITSIEVLDFGTGNLFDTYDTNKDTLFIFVKNAPKDKTSGQMTVRITQYIDCLDNNIDMSIQIKDKAAPVLIESADYVKSLVPGSNDMLVVKMSEGFDVTSMTNPFKFAPSETGTPYTWNMSFSSANAGTFMVAGNNDDVKDGDWIFINSDTKAIKDVPFGNIQTAPNNKRVPINLKTVTNIISAAYYDTSTIKDGYIDSVEIDLGANVSVSFAEKIRDAIVLPSRFVQNNRGAVNVNGTKFGFGVVETSAIQAANGNRKSFPPQTFVSSDEIILLPEALTDGSLTINVCDIDASKIFDRVAPVIVEARYSGDRDADTTLDVVFSEPINYKSGHPYLFWSVAGNEQFTMEFHDNNPTQPDNNILRYSVRSASIPFPVTNDSIWIVSGSGLFSDVNNNYQNSQTARAPLVVPPYKREFNVWAIALDKVNDQKFYDCYNIRRSERGTAIIVEATGPVSKDMSSHSISVNILDAMGNLLAENIEATNFGFNCNGKFYGAVIWDGKNTKGRNVGAGAYLGLIQVEIYFDDPAAPLEARTIRKLIGVAASKHR